MFGLSFIKEQSALVVMPEGRFDIAGSVVYNDKVNNNDVLTGNLIIDLSRCSYLSSSGIRCIIISSKIIRARGNKIILCNISPEVMQVIEIAGLRTVFTLAETLYDARVIVSESSNRSVQTSIINIDGQSFEFSLTGGDSRPAVIWENAGIGAYSELVFSFGTGYPADNLMPDAESKSIFATLNYCAGFVPFDSSLQPDFRIARNPEQGGVFVGRAVSFSDPVALLRCNSGTSVSIGNIIDYLFHSEVFSSHDKVKGAVIIDRNPVSPSASMVISVSDIIDDAEFFPESYSVCFQKTSKNIGFAGIKFSLDDINPAAVGNNLKDNLELLITIENLAGVETVDAASVLTDPLIWLFISGTYCSSTSIRTTIVAESGFEPEAWQEFIARRLYHDSSKLVIKGLHGGYSAQTFQVESLDAAGRKLRPTVMKISGRDLIARESERCKRYSLPYIMNNSAMVLGTEFYAAMGGLRYNFVGIGGEETRLKWLRNYFLEWPVEKLEPLFDKIFLQILKPWYGQPVQELLYPYRDHDPTLTFFRSLCETAGKELGINADEKYFLIEETGRRIINPYWFLKYEYKRRYETSVSYLSSVCHGDLNMQNILLDQEQNVYLIDFSETRPRSVISDFARLEAIFIIEHAVLDTPADMEYMISWLTDFYSCESFAQLSGMKWHGSGETVMKRNIALTIKMREYCRIYTHDDNNMLPYHLALLEWVLPIVCYAGTSLKHKKLSAIVAALICEKL